MGQPWGPYPGPPADPSWGTPPYGGNPSTPPPGRRPSWIWLVAGAVAVVAVTTIGLAIGSARYPVSRADGHHRPVTMPTGTAQPGKPKQPNAVGLPEEGVLVGDRDAPTTIDVFNEPLCPACGTFVTTYSSDIARAIDDKRVAVRFHLLDFLDDESVSGDYSTRAIAASYCVAGAGLDDNGALYVSFYAGLFAPDFQPTEGGLADHTDADLAALAERVGANADAVECIRSRQLRVAAVALGAKAMIKLANLGEVSTPAVFDGTRQVRIAPGWLDTL
ncbi:MAG TPA: DsbA family protein [Mycobacterium sp.]